MRAVESSLDAAIILEGQEALLFSSNNYLGLANHPALKQAAQEAIEQYRCGRGASRLISGSMDVHHKLEQRLAAFKKLTQPSFFLRAITPILERCLP